MNELKQHLQNLRSNEKKNDEDLVSRIHILIIKHWNSSFLLVSWLFSSFRFSSLVIDMNLWPSKLVVAVGHIYSWARLMLKGRAELCPWARELTSQVELSPQTQDYYFLFFIFYFLFMWVLWTLGSWAFASGLSNKLPAWLGLELISKWVRAVHGLSFDESSRQTTRPFCHPYSRPIWLV